MVVVGPPRSRFASIPASSRGRRLSEPKSPTRGDFQRDRDRIVHSTAFRRLKDKTQVFVYDEGDHYRTRLTHTIEVAQIARALARSLGLDEDLAETLALAHDLGHPPFGHSGEDAINACMERFGGFDHNAQALRIVTKLERRYAAFDGLNLTWETLEGLVKHNGPLTDREGRTLNGGALPHAVETHSREQDLWLWSYASPEAQAAAIADDIAYDAHDVDDGLRAGLITLDELAGVPLLGGDLLREVDRLHPGLEPPRRTYELIRRIITRLIEDVIAEAGKRLSSLEGEGADAVRRATAPIAAFSPDMERAEAALKAFLYKHVYRSSRLAGLRRNAEEGIKRMFARYMADDEALPGAWRSGVHPADEAKRARRVCDFIAGMTDRFAMSEYHRLFDAALELR